MVCYTTRYMTALAPILPWIQIIISVILVALILFQQSEAGLGSAFGQSHIASFHHKRGLERQLFIATIIVAALFVLSAILAIIIK